MSALLDIIGLSCFNWKWEREEQGTKGQNWIREYFWIKNEPQVAGGEFWVLLLYEHSEKSWDLWVLQFIIDYTMTEALRDDENNARLHGPLHMIYQQWLLKIWLVTDWTKKLKLKGSRADDTELVQVRTKQFCTLCFLDLVKISSTSFYFRV